MNYQYYGFSGLDAVSSDGYVTMFWTNLKTPSSGLMSGRNVRLIYLSTYHNIAEHHVSVPKTWCSGQILTSVQCSVWYKMNIGSGP